MTLWDGKPLEDIAAADDDGPWFGLNKGHVGVKMPPHEMTCGTLSSCMARFADEDAQPYLVDDLLIDLVGPSIGWNEWATDVGKLNDGRDDVQDEARKGHYGLVYVGPKKHGTDARYVFLRDWVSSPSQTKLCFDDAVVVDPDDDAFAEAAKNVFFRKDHIRVKYRGADSKQARDATTGRYANGVIVEKHVSLWFRDHWPEMWNPPTNAHDHTKPAGDDFRMNIRGRMVTFDVATRNADGRTYGKVSSKPKAMYHILASDDGGKFQIHRFVDSKQFQLGVDDLSKGRPLSHLCFRLNCARHFPYDMLAAAQRAVAELEATFPRRRVRRRPAYVR